MISCKQARPLAVAAFCAAMLSIFVLDTSSSDAAAQALFKPATSADLAASRSRAAPVDRQATRQRLVRIDPEVLARHVAPLGADTAANRDARAQKLDGVVRLNLFPDVAETFTRTDVEAEPLGGYVWEGAVRDKEFHEALLIINKGQISGRVQLHDRLFRIDPVAGSVHRITELDPRSFPPEAPPQVPKHLPRAATEPSEDQSAADARVRTEIRILVIYTAKAQATSPDIVNEIKQAVALANAAYKNGAVPIRLVLAGNPLKIPFAYNEGADIFKNLNHLTTANSFKTIRTTTRTRRRADLVSMFRQTAGGFCGVAWLPGNGVMPTPSAATKETGYSIMARDCVTNLSFHHELAHNMGLNHDRFQHKAEGGGNPPTSIYNFGFVNKPKATRSIMAYNTQCAPGFCTRVNYFSSPTVRGQPGNVVLGRARNTAGAADNTLRLKQTRTAISNYVN